MKKFSLLRSYIILVIIIKVIFLLLLLYSFYIKHLIKKYPNNKNYKISLEKIDKFKYKVEFIFTISIALLLIILFNPNHVKPIYIDHEARILLYLFGFLLLITADWNKFIYY
jgi:di/tricarboxylate transporter